VWCRSGWVALVECRSAVDPWCFVGGVSETVGEAYTLGVSLVSRTRAGGRRVGSTQTVWGIESTRKAMARSANAPRLRGW
jgi:hypothetical protein